MHGCVLVVDNDEDFLESCAEAVEQAGYEVCKAVSLEDAKQLLVRQRVHLALVDIRLRDDNDEKDISGLSLAKDPAYRSIPKIMLTRFPTYQHVREALGSAVDTLPPAVNFLAKQEGTEAMLAAVEQAFNTHVRVNWELTIRWQEQQRLSFLHLATLLEPDFPAPQLHHRAGELEDLFRRLFFSRSEIVIVQHLWSSEARHCLTVLAHSPTGICEQRLVVCGLKEPIVQERRNFENYAPKGGKGPNLVDAAETVHFGALAYALPQTDLECTESFSDFYETNKAAEVRKALSHLFGTMLAAWHRQEQMSELPAEAEPITRAFWPSELSDMPRNEMERRALALVNEARGRLYRDIKLTSDKLIVRFPIGSTVGYPNPVGFFYETSVIDDLCGAYHVIPGTLSGDSILVDQSGDVCPTDFLNAGPASLFHSACSMESVVRFDLIQPDEFLAVHEFEERLTAPGSLDSRLDAHDLEPEFRKPVLTIEEIRRQASAILGDEPAVYHKAMLVHALERLARYEPDHKHTRQELSLFSHALLAAAMICEMLRQQPVPAIKAELPGLVIN